MGELDFSGYVQSLGTTLTVMVLIASFIFTALTLVLLEMADVTSVLAQATLLVLIVAFALACLSMIILNTRIQLLSAPVSEGRPPSTPGWRFYNLLALLTVALMSTSISLMLFCRGLTYLGLVSLAIVVLWFVAYLTWLFPWDLLNRGPNK